jgi:hypothetical protein
MMIGRTPRWFVAVGIVTMAFGCDNVSWGGVRVRLEGPPVDTTAALGDTAAGEPEGAPAPQPEIPDMGPLLYAGFRSGDSARVTPVAELRNGGLQALPQGAAGEALGEVILRDRLGAGTKLTLFQEGVRIGTLTLRGLGAMSDEYCPPRPEAVGILELIPAAVDVQRFLAMEASFGRGWPFGRYAVHQSQYAQRAASLDLAAAAITDVGARWPSSLLDIRADLQVFPLRADGGDERDAVTATFLFNDELSVQPATEDAYSLMIIGEPQDGGFTRTYTWYRPVKTEGKGVPAPFARLDWDQDGADEILLQVLGSESRWWASLERRTDSWHLAFQDRCGRSEGENPRG